MVTREVEQTYEKVTTKTETEELVFCDGCADETTDNYITLRDIGPGHVEEMSDASDIPSGQSLVETGVVVQTLADTEEFHICPDCQEGLREHRRTIDTSLFEATDEKATEDKPTRTDDFEEWFKWRFFHDSSRLSPRGWIYVMVVGLFLAAGDPSVGAAVIAVGAMSYWGSKKWREEYESG